MFGFLQGPSKGFIQLEGHPSFEGSPFFRRVTHEVHETVLKLSQIWVAYFTWVTLQMHGDLHY